MAEKPKLKKIQKKGPKFWTTFFGPFFWIFGGLDFFSIQIFYKQKTCFFSWWRCRRRLSFMKKMSKILNKNLDPFLGFFWVWVFFANQIFYRQKTSFFGQARPFGARWAGPPLLFLGWKYWKSSQEKVSRKTALYFWGKYFFGHFTYQNVLICI